MDFTEKGMRFIDSNIIPFICGVVFTLVIMVFVV